MNLKFGLAVAVLVAATTGSATTWYKIRSDASGKPSWSKSADGSHGWATDPDSTVANTEMTVNGEDDFIIKGSLQLRTPNGSTSFAGKSLTFTEGGSILLKTGSSNVTRTITIADLIVDTLGVFGQGTDKTRFNIAGTIAIKSGSTLRMDFTTNGTNDDWRDMDIQASVTGDSSTKIDLRVTGKASNTAKGYLTGSFENFRGEIVSTTADASGAKFSLYLQNTFGGTFTSLPKSLVLFEIDPSKLPADKGLIWGSTTIPDVLKNTVVFYSATPLVGALMTFPSGTELDPAEFTIRYRTAFAASLDGTESSVALKRVENADGTVSLAVDESVPTTATLARGEDGAWSWRFADAAGNDVTDTCGLTAPTKDIKVLFATQEEFDQLKAMTFDSSGLLWTLTELAGDMELTGLDFQIPNGVTVDLAGHHLALAGSVLAAAASSTTLTSTIADAVLEINVPEDEADVISSVAISGGAKLQVWKTGKGQVTMNRAQGFGANDKFSLIVKEGLVCKANSNSAVLGAQYSNIRIEKGAQLDVRGRKYWDYNYYIAGDGPDGTGALINTMSNDDTASGDGHLRHIFLDDDATIAGTVVWALNFSQASKKSAHNVTFNGHTLTLGGEYKIYWVRLNPQDAGKLVVNKSEVYGLTPDFSLVDVEVNQQLDSNSGNYFTPVKSLKFAPEATWTGYGDPVTAATTVLETYRPAATAMPSVTLGDADHLTPTLDLSTQTTTLDGTGLAFASGATVTVDVGTRRLAGQQRKLVSWTAKPDPSVRFKLSGGLSGVLSKCDDGLYFSTGLMVIIK